MSSPFGIPPPPPSPIFEPGRGTALATPPDDAPAPAKPSTQEPDRWRRRATVFLAFVAVGLLVFANLAVWLHVSAFSTSRAESISAATFDDMAAPVIATLDPAVVAQVQSGAVAALGPGTTVDQARIGDVPARTDAAVRAAVLSPAFRAQWKAAVVAASQRQHALGTGAAPTAAEAAGQLVIVDTNALGPVITADLARGGYSFMAGRKLTLPAYSVTTTDSAANHQGTIALANLWWLLLLGSIGVGAGAIALASRRLRLATIMAVDAAVMLAVCLLLVPLIRQVVDDQVVDSKQIPLVLHAYDAAVAGLITQTLVLMVVAICTAIGLGAVVRTRGQRRRAEPAA